MILLPQYLKDCPRIMPRAQELGLEFARKPTDGCTCFFSWGNIASGVKSYAIETGFFWDGSHLDSCGLYRHSSFNTKEGALEYHRFRAPETALNVIKRSRLHPSKYRQTTYPVKWEGVVLALQNPGDRSVLSCGSIEDYYDFVEGACRYYGKHLFLKAHPWNTGKVFDRLKSYTDKYGCRIEKTDHSVIEYCKFVLVYNSSFCVDCFVRGVPVAQFAPGYFYQTSAVEYTNRQYPDEVSPNIYMNGLKLADFLIWRYCFNIAMPKERWVDMLNHFAQSNDMFPMKLEHSYAANVEYSKPCA